MLLTEHRRTLEIASGLLIVLMGAVLAGFGGMLLQQERRLQPARKPAGPIGAVVAGAGFAIGWTPCVGPTLAAILALAGRSGQALDGAILLAVYSLGLGVPFLLSGLLFTRGLSSLGPLRRRASLFVRGSGIVLMGLGVLLAARAADRPHERSGECLPRPRVERTSQPSRRMTRAARPQA